MAMLLFAPAAGAAPSYVPAGKPFGFNARIDPPGEPLGSMRMLNAAKTGGATHMRMGINWRGYEGESSASSPVPPSLKKPMGEPTGNPETDKVDSEYSRIVGLGMTPVLMVHSAPAWASTFHTCLESAVDRLNTTKCPTDWQKKAIALYAARDRQYGLYAFAAEVARRYPRAVIEGTNEPDILQQLQPQYHPPIDVVADSQCVLARAVRSVDPDRKILSASFYKMDYAATYLARIKGQDCYSDFNIHLFGVVEVRTGPASGIRARLQEVHDLLGRYGDGQGFWITETGISNTYRYNDNKEAIGEALVAKAFPRWVTSLANDPEIDGLLVHTLREGSFGEGGDQVGFAQLSPDYSVKQPGGGILPRFCWLALSAGNSYPGCEGLSLPPPPGPTRPSFFKRPELLFGSDTTIGKVTRVLFFEEGTPDPDVRIVWYRCNAVGTGCNPVVYDSSAYLITSADRLNTVKAVVSMTNASGSVRDETALSPVIK